MSLLSVFFLGGDCAFLLGVLRKRVFDDGFSMVNLWWLGGFSWFVRGVLFELKFFIFLRFIFGSGVENGEDLLDEMFER
jgi:hypothetical protein